ncbi:hypothetical protein JYU34_007723 [Plutella xylostella]|uniref:Uncharacterized protein n=1 Tax=Plutella xylostella TaxID=51655 RepID=A0ABQ7QR33_PLUXY|nr:hypothetical protein JYU34_007723 [Plutella xylostella]
MWIDASKTRAGRGGRGSGSFISFVVGAWAACQRRRQRHLAAAPGSSSYSSALLV